MSRRQFDAFPHLCYSPTERRRLARSGSGPRRINARRAPIRRRTWTGFTRSAIDSMVRLCVVGFREGDYEIRDLGVGHFAIAVRRPLADLVTLAATVYENRPLGIIVDVVSSLP